MDQPDQWGPGVIIGGHRLLRRLGAGPTAEVWLGAPAAAEDGERVALKLIRAGSGADRAAREAEALWRARGPHVVRLRDVVAIGSGTPFLILDAVPHDLPAVLARGLDPGAAVTVLVPIAQALARLHELGVTHGGVRLAAVGLDRRGAPVLLGFGAAEIGPVTAAGRAADCAAFAALALVVLASIPERDRDASWHRLAAWLGASRPGGSSWFPSFLDRCYDLAEPQPVAIAASEPLGAVMLAAAGREGAAPADPGEPAPPRLLTVGLGRAALTRAARAWTGIRRVRARFWIPAAVAAAALLAVIALPVAPGTGAVAATSEVAAVERSPTPVASAEPPAAETTATPTPSGTATVRDALGGAFIVEIEGPRGIEQLVLVAVPDGWEVRDHFAAEPRPVTTPGADPTPGAP